MARFCTQELKVLPIKELTGLEDDETMIGVRADEPIRIAKMRRRGFSLPLVSIKATSLDIQLWLAKNPDFDLGLEYRDGVTALGNCDMCFLKGPRQIRSLVAAYPERAVWWATQEEKIGATFRKGDESFAVMLKKYADQQDFIGHDEEAIACFCGD